MVCRVIFEDGYEEAVEVSEPLIFLGLTLGVTPGQADRIEKHTTEVRRVPSCQITEWPGRPVSST